MKNVRPHSALTMPENSIQPHNCAPAFLILNEAMASNTPNTMKKAPTTQGMTAEKASGWIRNMSPMMMSRMAYASAQPERLMVERNRT